MLGRTRRHRDIFTEAVVAISEETGISLGEVWIICEAYLQKVGHFLKTGDETEIRHLTTLMVAQYGRPVEPPPQVDRLTAADRHPGGPSRKECGDTRRTRSRRPSKDNRFAAE
jgi:hypothetical protein